ncbi:unnamed protein product, partial [marine sediment metagenome]
PARKTRRKTTAQLRAEQRRAIAKTDRKVRTRKHKARRGMSKSDRGRNLLKAIAANHTMKPATKAKARATIKRKYGC